VVLIPSLALGEIFHRTETRKHSGATPWMEWFKINCRLEGVFQKTRATFVLPLQGECSPIAIAQGIALG